MYGKPNRLGELKCTDESRTKQSFEEESNINVIFARAIKNGWDPRLLPQAEMNYADVSSIGDFRDAQDRIVRGREIFESLSAQDRLTFGNDPGAFFEFAQDPANADEVVRLRFGQEAVDALRAGRADAESVSVPGRSQGDGPGRGPGAGGAGAGPGPAGKDSGSEPKGGAAAPSAGT